MTQPTYHVRVRSTSSRYSDGAPVIERTCRHSHRTYQVAERCMGRLVNRQPDGTHSAYWHRAEIADNYGNVQEPDLSYLDEHVTHNATTRG